MTITQRLKIGFDEYPITFNEAAGNVAQNAPWYLTSFMVALCTVVCVGVIANIANKCLSNRDQKRKRPWKRSLKSYFRLLIIIFCIAFLFFTNDLIV